VSHSHVFAVRAALALLPRSPSTRLPHSPSSFSCPSPSPNRVSFSIPLFQDEAEALLAKERELCTLSALLAQMHLRAAGETEARIEAQQGEFDERLRHERDKTKRYDAELKEANKR
jgi:hypothetical protein